MDPSLSEPECTTPRPHHSNAQIARVGRGAAAHAVWAFEEPLTLCGREADQITDHAFDRAFAIICPITCAACSREFSRRWRGAA